MYRVLIVCYILLVGGCGDFNPVNFDGFLDGLFEPSPGFFSRMDAATDWVSGVEQCGIKVDGGLWCWEIDQDKNITVHQVAVKSTFHQVVASTAGVCALDKARDATCWLQQGVDGVPYTTKGPWKTLSMGYDRACGIRDDGTLWCWGTLGYNTAQTEPATGNPIIIDYTSAPRQLTDSSWLSAASGTNDTTGWSLNLSSPVGPFCGVRSDKTLWCYHYFSEATFDPEKDVDVLISFGSVPTWTSVYVGAARICGLRQDRRLVCYQDGLEDELPGKWLSFSMHGTTLCGVQEDHSLWCWGTLPGSGDLYSSHHTDERRKNWASVQVGPHFACGVTLDGKLYCLELYSSTNFGGPTEAASPIMVDAQTLKN